MARYIFAVYSNPVEGREDEYNDWYSNRHIKDLLACPGVVSARRLTLAARQIRNEPILFKYFSLYEIETDDLQTFLNELISRAGTDRMPHTTALGTVDPVFWQVME